MDSIISSVTQSLLTKSLDVSLANHRIIANNIANVSTQGFKPVKLEFSEVMSEVSSLIDSGSENDLREAVSNISDTDLPTTQSQEAKVMLDKEMAEIMENSLRYNALILARKGIGSIMKSAIKGGRG